MSRRRTVLKLLGAGAGAAAIGSVAHVGASESEDEPSFVLEQGDECVELTPLSGDETVEEFYDYRVPDTFESYGGSLGYSYSSEGTTHLQEDYTSILFLYDGPEGLSLVVVHGRYVEEEDVEDDGDDGGVVTFDVGGMPEGASWVVRDDYYAVDGEPADTNVDRWDVDGSDQQIDWAYRGGRTDGGAARGLGEAFEFTIDPAFNDDAELADDEPSFGPIEDWKVLTWDGESPEGVSLQMDEAVTIRTGTCDDADDGDPDDGDEDDQDGEPDDQDGEKDKDEDHDDEQDGEPDDQDGSKDKDEENDDEDDQDDEHDDEDGSKDEEEDDEEVC